MLDNLYVFILISDKKIVVILLTCFIVVTFLCLLFYRLEIK